jgi:hypothetical protein
LTGLAQQKCFEHSQREASSRCPACKRYFCRECVVEHGGRITCTACLRALSKKKAGVVRSYVALYAALGFLMAWLVFYQLGKFLLLMPANFHEGAL